MTVTNAYNYKKAQRPPPMFHTVLFVYLDHSCCRLGTTTAAGKQTETLKMAPALHLLIYICSQQRGGRTHKTAKTFNESAALYQPVQVPHSQTGPTEGVFIEWRWAH